MGTVYEAKDLHVSATVALKEAFPDGEVYSSAFEREARLLANLSHEAFPKVMDFFIENGGHYLVMEFVDGKDLDNFLRERSRPFEVEEVLNWADQILDSLEYLQDCGIVHRDIKPQNLKCSLRGKIKLLDFGIAKGAIEDITTVQHGSIPAATLYYAPLEQSLRADPDTFRILEVTFPKQTTENFHKGTDARSDLYALGATLYHLLANQRPVKAYIRASSIWHGKGDPLQPIQKLNDNLSHEIAAVLNRAMEVERENRYPTATCMREELKRARTVTLKSQEAIRDKFLPGKVTVYNCADSKFLGNAIDVRKKESEEIEHQRLINKFTVVVKRAKSLGYYYLLENLKSERFVISDESIDKLNKKIDVEIKILRELEFKEGKEREKKELRRKELARGKIKEPEEEREFQPQLIETDQTRKRILTFITTGTVVSLVLGLGIILGFSQPSRKGARNQAQIISNTNKPANTQIQKKQISNKQSGN